MKEVFEAFYSRIKSPVFGYFILAFIIYNWKVLFYLLASGVSTNERFIYFDSNTDHYSLLIGPLIFGIIGAVLYPWINYLFIWIAQKPNEFRHSVQVSSENKMLILKQQYEKERAKLLEIKENELIKRAKRDEEVQSVTDNYLRIDLEEKIKSMRNELDKKDATIDWEEADSQNKELASMYMQLAKMHEDTGDVEMAKQLMSEAIGHRKSALR